MKVCSEERFQFDAMNGRALKSVLLVFSVLHSSFGVRMDIVGTAIAKLRTERLARCVTFVGFASEELSSLEMVCDFFY